MTSIATKDTICFPCVLKSLSSLSTHSALHPVHILLLVIKVNVLSLSDARYGGHGVVGSVSGVQRDAKDHSVPHYHQEGRVIYSKTGENMRKYKIFLSC